MEITEFALRMGCAIVAGLLIGFEREYKNKHAGLKTNTLVALGSAIFVLISLRFFGEEYSDITRVLSQVVIGIGFIGGGTIVQHGKDIHGLTTAATIWCSAGAGCLAAFGMFGELGILAVAVVLINLIFGIVDRKIGREKTEEE
ncbi:MAG: magnesium transporter MgtC [Flavobacteriaceae bacterium]|nr:magnesium transporter MgtC [Flavobacteriaceae bacterium]